MQRIFLELPGHVLTEWCQFTAVYTRVAHNVVCDILAKHTLILEKILQNCLLPTPDLIHTLWYIKCSYVTVGSCFLECGPC
jgi:hypothetical protein